MLLHWAVHCSLLPRFWPLALSLVLPFCHTTYFFTIILLSFTELFFSLWIKSTLVVTWLLFLPPLLSEPTTCAQTFIFSLTPSSTLSSSLPCCISFTPLSCTLSLRDGHMLPAVALSWSYHSPCLFSHFFVFSFSAVLLFCSPGMLPLPLTICLTFCSPFSFFFSSAVSEIITNLLFYLWSQDKYTSCCAMTQNPSIFLFLSHCKTFSAPRFSGRFWLKCLRAI